MPKQNAETYTYTQVKRIHIHADTNAFTTHKQNTHCITHSQDSARPHVYSYLTSNTPGVFFVLKIFPGQLLLYLFPEVFLCFALLVGTQIFNYLQVLVR